MEDAHDALLQLYEQANGLGNDPSRISMAGRSAVGAMAACLAIMARDRDEYPVAFQLLEAPRLSGSIAQGARLPYG